MILDFFFRNYCYEHNGWVFHGRFRRWFRNIFYEELVVLIIFVIGI